MTKITVGSLFSGIGGFEIGLERTGGFNVRWQCENDGYCQRVLARHWPDVQRYDDIRTVDFRAVERVDLLCGGFPCSDISNAGTRAGIDGERSGLWSEYARAICEIRPRYVFIENVSALLGRGMERVLGDLAASGYDAEWEVIRASDFGAWHERERVWILAYPLRERVSRPVFAGRSGEVRQRRQSGETAVLDWAETWDAVAFRSGTNCAMVSGNGDGLPDWAHRVKSLGNSIVPAIAEWIGNRILEYEKPQEF